MIKKITTPLSLLLVLVLAVVVRLPLLNGSLWLDEAAQALESARPLSEQYKIAPDFQPPLFHYLVHFMLDISSAEYMMRLTSLIPGILTIYILYKIIDEHVGRRAALFGAFLLSISSFHVFFSQELRPYALACFFAALSWWSLLKMLKAKKIDSSFIWFVVATVGGLYSMYVYPFISIAQLIYVFVEDRKRLRDIFIAFFISALCFVPWLPFFQQQLHVGTSLQGELPGWSKSVATPQLKALPLVLSKFFVGQARLQDSFLIKGIAGISILIFLYASLCIQKNKQYRFLLYWFFIPLCTVWLESFIVPVIAPKRLMVILPAMWGILAVWMNQLPKRMKTIFLFFFFVSQCFTLFLYYTNPALQREDWGKAITDTEKIREGKRSTVVFAFPESFAPWRWYADINVPNLSTGILRVDTPDQLDIPFAHLPEYTQVLVFDYLRDLSDPHRSIDTWLTKRGYTQTGLLDEGPIGFIHVYTK
jgi:mannosyltransferase